MFHINKSIKIIINISYEYICYKIKCICNKCDQNSLDVYWDTFIINCCESLKTTNIFFIKAMQTLSSDNVHLSSKVQTYMDRMSDNVPYNDSDFDITEIEQLLQTINIKLNVIPIASGTIAIVFKGYDNDREYAIKIKRTNIKNKMIDSIDNMHKMIILLNNIPQLKKYNLVTHYDNTIQYMYEQLDFNKEWDNINTVYNYNKRIESYIIPQPYFKYITESNNNIIIMDFVNGIKLKDVLYEDKDKFCELISKFGIKSMFFDGHVHGDLHQGNCRFVIDEEDKENREKIIVYDFGILCKISKEEQDILFRFYKNTFTRDYHKSAFICLNELVFPENMFKSLNIEDKQILQYRVENCIFNCFGKYKVITSTDIRILSNILYEYNLKPKEWFCKLLLSFVIHESLIQNLSTSKTFLEYGEELLSEIYIDLDNF